MAKEFGGPSKFIVSNVKKNAAIYAILAILCVAGALACYILAYQTFGEKRFAIWFIFFIVYVFVLYLVYKVFEYAFYGDTFIRGGVGESDICDELDELTDDYSYFRGVKINGTNFDVDFVVVGPTGIFAIDAKSHRGNIEYKNGNLLKNGKNFEKNVIGQAKSEALFVHNLIAGKFKAEIFVNPVIVFSSYWAKLYFGLRKIGNVHVVQKKWLNKLIKEQPYFRYPLDRRLIEQELEKICNK